MVIVHSETVKSDFEGTIINIETIGDFSNYPDSRKYQNITPVILGYIDKNGWKIHCAENNNSIKEIKYIITELVSSLERPFYAFNCDFEKGVFFQSCKLQIDFRELQERKFESKKAAVSSLKLENYNDPFNDNGKKCKISWENGNTEDAIKHNRSCLLKERDILLKRGYHKT